MNIRLIPVSKLNPAPYNPRKDLRPGDPEYEKIARSIDEFGCVEPLVWNKRTGTLVGGHQRLKVLIARGAKQVDVSVVDLPVEREKALNVALNKIAGEWDEARLASLLDELTRLPDFDVTLTGFEVPERDELLAKVLAHGEDHRDEAFDVDAALRAAGKGPSITKPGDLILLGRDPRTQHRLLCGDSTDPLQVRRLMNGAGGGARGGGRGNGRGGAGGAARRGGGGDKSEDEGAAPATNRAALFVTDPPYLVGYDGTNHPGTPSKAPAKARGAKHPTRSNNKDWSATYGVTWDDASGDPDLYRKFCRAAIDEAIRPDAAWYCWHASRRQAMLESVWQEMGAFVHCQIIWTKNRPVLTRTWYAWQHEPCLFGWMKGKKPPRCRQPGESMPSTVWEVDTLANGADRPDHPTPKPLQLFEIPMREHTRPGEICYEPFAGSGTQIVAAQRLGRRCFALEISPVYCDLIVRRFIAFAGEAAVAPDIAKRYRLRTEKAA